MSFLLLDDPKLIYFLTSNPKCDPAHGAIPLKGPRWLLPAWWPVVQDHVRDECTRPLPRDGVTRHQKRQLELYRRGLPKPPRPYA